MSILTWIADRARERSTWLGLSGIATSLGVVVAPELQEAIIAAGVAIAGLVATITRD